MSFVSRTLHPLSYKISETRLFWCQSFYMQYLVVSLFFIPCTRSASGDKAIVVGVHIYIFKKIESYFSDRLTFSNIHSRTSR